MNVKLILKNSWIKLKSEIRVIAVLFFYIAFALAVIFGIFSMASTLKQHLILEPAGVTTRVDGAISESNFAFFTGVKEDEVGESEQYNTYVLNQLNQFLSSQKDEALDEKKSDDVLFLKTLGAANGRLDQVKKAIKLTDENQIFSDAVKQKYLKDVDDLDKYAVFTQDNIYTRIVKDYLETQDFKTNVFGKLRGASYASNSIEVTIQDFNNKTLTAARTSQKFASEKNKVDLFVTKNQYDKLAGKTINFIGTTNESYILRGKVVGYAINYTQMISVNKYSFVTDMTNFKNYLDANKLPYDLITSRNLAVQDKKNYGRNQKNDRINQVLANWGISSKAELKIGAPKTWIMSARPNGVIPYNSYKITFSIYDLLTYLIVLLLAVLTFAIMFFVMKQLISSDKKILYFLKSMGTPRMKLTLVSVTDVFYPIIFAMIVSLPLLFVVRHFLFSAVSSIFDFRVSYFEFRWTLFFFVGLTTLTIMLLFFVLVLINISNKTLSPQNVFDISRTEKVLNRIKPGFKKFFHIKNNLWISFMSKNFYQNFVSMVVIAVAMGVLLFGQLFSFSADESLRATSKYYGPFTEMSQYDATAPLLMDDEQNQSHLYQYIKYSDETMEDNSLKTDQTNRRIKVSDDGTTMKIFDDNGKERVIDLKKLKPTDVPVLKNAIKDLSGRYLMKSDLNALLNSEFDYRAIDPDLAKWINEIKAKTVEIKSEYPEYNGSNISFNTNYRDSDDSVTWHSTSAYFSDQTIFESTGVKDVNTVDGNFFSKTKLYPELANINDDSSTFEIKLNHETLWKINHPNEDYPDSEKNQPWTESELQSALVAKNRANFYFFERLLAGFDKKTTRKNDDGYSLEVPVVDAVVYNSLKDVKNGYFSIPLFTYRYTVNSKIVNKTLYVPIFIKVIASDVLNPVSGIFVNKTQFNKAFEDSLQYVKLGLKDSLTISSKKLGLENSVYQHFQTGIEMYEQNQNAYIAQNNFLGSGTPRVIQNVVFPANGDPKKYESYNLNSNTLQNLPISFVDFPKYAAIAREKLTPMADMIANISSLSTIVAVLVSFLLIYLILRENDKIIKILKIIGYRKREVTRYIIFGYFVAATVAAAIAVGISYFMFVEITAVMAADYHYYLSLFFSPTFITLVILIPFFYMALVSSALVIATRRSNVNSIEQAN